eukprot:CAMPEP_0170583436 /NCGR_PEP_ID=MMETSP0224-20130122/8135_1 /TAXON_ID=285029 /ORGANISM="Togula jolla, Strain CCCM 725" /LENGTH=124 /DNA_ID=CAMNT_0010906765 /DNA_START=156 /DNA_END=531 /DNA_ORIENTATION=-
MENAQPLLEDSDSEAESGPLLELEPGGHKEPEQCGGKQAEADAQQQGLKSPATETDEPRSMSTTCSGTACAAAGRSDAAAAAAAADPRTAGCATKALLKVPDSAANARSESSTADARLLRDVRA